jgi:hypothetical protein
VTPWALSALALLGAGWAGYADGKTSSRLPIIVVLFAALVLFNVQVVSPAYTPAGLYQPLLLLTAFFVARRLTHRAERDVAVAAFLLCAALAAWGLYEVGLGGLVRAQALFETPATFSAVVNLTFVPLLAAMLVGVRYRMAVAGIVLLSAAIFAADSRGGLFAMAGGLGFAAILGVRARLLRARGIVIVLAMLAAGWVLAIALRALPAPHTEAGLSATDRAASSLSRLELFALSWSAWKERPIVGTGYLTYRYTLEQGRAQVPSYGTSSETWFVHNDYLQMLQEMGPVGLVALLGLTLLPLLLAYRQLPGLVAEGRPAVIAIGAGIAAMSVHALVDFPFYVPICLLLYGALLGALDRRLSDTATRKSLMWRRSPLLRVARAGALTLAVFILLRPVAAEAAAEWGLRMAASGDGRAAATWLGAARRIEPRDWRYHWYAGQFWIAQAGQSGRREAAKLAADAFAAGYAANPLEVKNLLGRIAVHRHYGQLLDEPADHTTLQQWIAHAATLAPMNAEVRRELAR